METQSLPNEITKKAILDANTGENLIKFDSIEQFFEELDRILNENDTSNP